MKDRLYRQIHNRVIKLTPSSMSDIITRQEQGRLSRQEKAYLEALDTLQLRNNTLMQRHLENCFKKSEDWTHV
jgi:hypothetical protein